MQSSIIKEEFVVNWKRVFVTAFKKWWILIICFVCGGILGFGVGALTITPVYSCDAVYLVSFTTGGTGISDMYSQWNLASKILQNCKEVAELNKFTNILAEDLNQGISETDENYMSSKKIAKRISYNKSSNGGTLITATVTSPDATECKKIVNSLTKNFADYMSEQFELEEGKSIINFVLVNEPEVPESPSSRFSKKLFAAVGALTGAALSYAILCFIGLADGKIKTETDITNKYNAPVLGTIYDFAESYEMKGDYSYEYKA